MQEIWFSKVAIGLWRGHVKPRVTHFLYHARCLLLQNIENVGVVPGGYTLKWAIRGGFARKGCLF